MSETTDIVAELDAVLLWLSKVPVDDSPTELEQGPDILQRARAEILALRDANRQASDLMEAMEDKARVEALEEAAGVCERMAQAHCEIAAKEIRALKDKP